LAGSWLEGCSGRKCSGARGVDADSVGYPFEATREVVVLILKTITEPFLLFGGLIFSEVVAISFYWVGRNWRNPSWVASSRPRAE
jgi:hypothetical protein